ncbi:hypothetical protein BG015_005113, partial [Linnemannia schmuckeri]
SIACPSEQGIRREINSSSPLSPRSPRSPSCLWDCLLRPAHTTSLSWTLPAN